MSTLERNYVEWTSLDNDDSGDSDNDDNNRICGQYHTQEETSLNKGTTNALQVRCKSI